MADLTSEEKFFMLSLERRQEKLEIHHLLFHMVVMVLFMMLKFILKDDNEDLPSGVSMVVRVYIIQKRERFKLEINEWSSRK